MYIPFGFCIFSHFHQLPISTMISSPSACTVIVHESKGTSHDTSGNTDAMFGSGKGWEENLRAKAGSQMGYIQMWNSASCQVSIIGSGECLHWTTQAYREHVFFFVWSSRSPNVKVWSLLGRVTPSRLWLNPLPNVKCSMLSGRWRKYWVVVVPAIRVTPCNASSSWETGRLLTEHHAA